MKFCNQKFLASTNLLNVQVQLLLSFLFYNGKKCNLSGIKLQHATCIIYRFSY